MTGQIMWWVSVLAASIAAGYLLSWPVTWLCRQLDRAADPPGRRCCARWLPRNAA